MYEYSESTESVIQLNTLYEGQVSQADPSGFGRFIDAQADFRFTGYFKSTDFHLFVSNITQKGTGLFFSASTGNSYSGIYEEG